MVRRAVLLVLLVGARAWSPPVGGPRPAPTCASRFTSPRLRSFCPACPVFLRSSPLGSPGEDADEATDGVLKQGKSRYEAYYEGQGQGGKEGAIDTTAVDDEG